MPTRLSRIDELTRPDHSHLREGDHCFYLGEYTARAGFTFSLTKDLIQNLKKPMERRGMPEWVHKERAIAKFARMLREALPDNWLTNVTYVPVPPSRTQTDPLYDDRLLKILTGAFQGHQVDVRHLVIRTENSEPAHLLDAPRDPGELSSKLILDDAIEAPAPSAICVFDDVLTTGASFRAMELILRPRFPGIPIAGLFLARRAPQTNAL